MNEKTCARICDSDIIFLQYSLIISRHTEHKQCIIIWPLIDLWHKCNRLLISDNELANIITLYQ